MADNFEQLGFQVKVDGADSAVSRLDDIIDRLEKINQLQGKKVSTSKKVIDTQKQEEKQTKINTKSLTSYISKLTSTVVIARKFARVISSSIQESANYVENLNLFAVAYGDVYQETLKWALDLADGFGLASNEVLRFAGTFRQLSTSLGIVEDTANSVSKTVTQLGYDISALFNTSVENAMEKLQSGLFSGNVRPLRAYGIDISQNQIDALFETNQALASLGVNARNLSQSDKVLARLIITLRDGSNAFGTMNREINTLQSQIRILQGSFSNFKLAIGDLVQEPLRQSLVYVNGFIIAMTNIIRLFKPLKTTDENNVFTSTAMGAEEASEAVDNLNGQLADFDKFNVLGGQSQGGSQLAVTEALTAELEKQQKLYQEQVDAMSKVQNEATLVAKRILDWFVIIDENGKFVDFTDNAKELGANISAIAGALGSLKLAQITASFATLGSTLKTTFSLKNLPIMAIVASLAYMYTTNEDFRNSVNNLASTVGNSLLPILDTFVGLLDTVAPIITPIIQGIAELVAGTINLANNLGILEPAIYAIIGIKLSGWLFGVKKPLLEVIKYFGKPFIDGLKSVALQLTTNTKPALLGTTKALTGMQIATSAVAGVLGYLVGDMLLNNLGQEARSVVAPIMAVVGAVTSLTVALLAMQGTLTWGVGLPVILGAVGVAIAGVKSMIADANNIQGFADGGYTNANLIMTHENGKREWVGKAAGSSAIVNDTQMSDIMEVAVAKGVYNALSARSAMGGNVPTNETIVVKIGEEAVFNAVRKTARRQGRDFATV